MFFGVFPPPEIQSEAHLATASLRRRGDGVAWVRAENLHLTMRFLGECSDEQARRAGEAAREATAGSPAFPAALGAAGAFPDPRRARVLWLGMAVGEPEVTVLATALEEALERHAFPREGRRFAAHLTLGRLRSGEADWRGKLAAVRVEPTPWRVSELRLVRSVPSPSGSRYETALAVPLPSG
jgi:2'-5' RNA ligase